jgi:hypothetical protein
MINNNQLPLTIVIITDRNDDRFINALRSSQIASHVLILDNNSNNDWNRLTKKYQFSIVSHEKEIFNFAKTRNKLLKRVKTKWVMFLDSDESLGSSTKEIKSNTKSIEQVINNDLFDGVTITRKDVFLGKSLKFGEAGNIKITRLFKVEKGKFASNVHEVARINGKLGESDIIVSHFSHNDVSSFLKKISKYSKMASDNERSSKLTNFLKMIFYPILKFLQNYFFKLGFLDGYRGLIYTFMMSFHSFFVRIFYFEKYFQKNSNENKT